MEIGSKNQGVIHCNWMKIYMLVASLSHWFCWICPTISLKILPDSIADFTNLQRFYLSSNLLVSLPDSIGFLKNLQGLNVSANRLKTLPNSISSCSALIELDVSFNQLTYLPTNLGHDLVNLQKLCVHLNRIRSFPSSLCDMQSLRYLDVHFNKLRSLPLAIGKLTKLEIMNANNNFTDLLRIPDSIGDLVNLNELDLSNNQIRELPYSFGRLQKLHKPNLDQNPLVCPPMNIVRQGVEALREHKAKIWLEFLLEEEKRSPSEASNMHPQDSWLWRGGLWFGGRFSALTGNLTKFLGTTNKSRDEDYSRLAAICWKHRDIVGFFAFVSSDACWCCCQTLSERTTLCCVCNELLYECEHHAGRVLYVVYLWA